MDAFRKACSFLLGRTRANPSSPAMELCHAFLTILSGTGGEPRVEEARRRLDAFLDDPSWGEAAAFLHRGIRAVEREIASVPAGDANLRARLDRLASTLPAPGEDESRDPPDWIESFWSVFCPQAVGVASHWEERVRGLREGRTVHGLSLCPDPLQRPAEEILFSANVLLTVPPKEVDPSTLGLDDAMLHGVIQALSEEQAYWYDHPVPIGAPPGKNEILHGLRGLSETLAFEKKRGTAAPADRLDVVLSVSVTHPSLHGLAREYIEHEVSREPRIRDLDLHVFTEEDTTRLVEDFLCPAARRFGPEGAEPGLFFEIFGVDGPYARHYNFLKAVSALWQVARDPGVRATFKIDLDQVFPQKELVGEMGVSAFELLCTPLWGARGKDPQDRDISLGMIAGALVNEADIHRGLFTPDVTLPAGPWPPDRWVFTSQVPQALSTEAEMMACYDGPFLDGTSRCLSRVHVTGGTTGIRVESLRRHRPFTLSCIGRAEDQAYLMSVLGSPDNPCLRYAHIPGLIMRHDKHAFAREAIRAAAAGKVVGDYERMLLFSGYAEALPRPAEEVRSCLDPFTGCFISALPASTALLCLALKALSCREGIQDASGIRPEELLRLGARRLGPLLERRERDPDWMARSCETERRAWQAYYDILERVEAEAQKGKAEAIRLVEKARGIVEETRVRT